MNQKGVKSESKKVRNIATVVYPESAPENWIEVLSGFHIPCFISPLHDKDINPNGEPKKPHYHVLITLEGPREVNYFDKIIASIGGVGCEVVNSLRGYARYLVHMDNPEKYQYSVSDVRSLSGAVYSSVVNLASDKYRIIREMVSFCNEQGISSYSVLLEWCMINREDWFQCLCDSGTYVIKEYLKSKTWLIAQEEKEADLKRPDKW